MPAIQITQINIIIAVYCLSKDVMDHYLEDTYTSFNGGVQPGRWICPLPSGSGYTELRSDEFPAGVLPYVGSTNKERAEAISYVGKSINLSYDAIIEHFLRGGTGVPYTYGLPEETSESWQVITSTQGNGYVAPTDNGKEVPLRIKIWQQIAYTDDGVNEVIFENTPHEIVINGMNDYPLKNDTYIKFVHNESITLYDSDGNEYVGNKIPEYRYRKATGRVGVMPGSYGDVMQLLPGSITALRYLRFGVRCKTSIGNVNMLIVGALNYSVSSTELQTSYSRTDVSYGFGLGSGNGAYVKYYPHVMREIILSNIDGELPQYIYVGGAGYHVSDYTMIIETKEIASISNNNVTTYTDPKTTTAGGTYTVEITGAVPVITIPHQNAIHWALPENDQNLGEIKNTPLEVYVPTGHGNLTIEEGGMTVSIKGNAVLQVYASEVWTEVHLSNNKTLIGGVTSQQVTLSPGSHYLVFAGIPYSILAETYENLFGEGYGYIGKPVRVPVEYDVAYTWNGSSANISLEGYLYLGMSDESVYAVRFMRYANSWYDQSGNIYIGGAQMEVDIKICESTDIDAGNLLRESGGSFATKLDVYMNDGHYEFNATGATVNQIYGWGRRGYKLTIEYASQSPIACVVGTAHGLAYSKDQLYFNDLNEGEQFTYSVSAPTQQTFQTDISFPLNLDDTVSGWTTMRGLEGEVIPI